MAQDGDEVPAQVGLAQGAGDAEAPPMPRPRAPDHELTELAPGIDGLEREEAGAQGAGGKELGDGAVPGDLERIPGPDDEQGLDPPGAVAAQGLYAAEGSDILDPFRAGADGVGIQDPDPAVPALGDQGRGLVEKLLVGVAVGEPLEVGGGAQDGAAKTALGGTLTVMKAPNADGAYVDGSVGKCFAYGAQRGRFLVQGGADARAGIRLSGADVVIGGDVKGFAFEYMTGGRAAILGDPGRWICSGMSGGAVFVRHDPERGLDEAGLRDRIAKGAKVAMRPPGEAGQGRKLSTAPRSG